MSLSVPESLLTSEELARIANFRREVADSLDEALVYDPTIPVAGTTNTLAKFTSASTIGNSSLSDDGGGTVTQAQVANSAGFNVGDNTASANDVENGVRITTFSDGNNYIDFKTYSAGSTVFRYGAGAAAVGNTWFSLAHSTGLTTFAGNLTISGNLTAAGNLDVNGDLSKFGSSDGQIYISNGTGINFGYATNAESTGNINYAGYQDGATQFRNLVISDGKNAAIATFTGSTKAVAFAGNVTLGDSSTDRVGIGTAPDSDTAVLFASALGNKIVLYSGGPNSYYGFGIQANQLQYFGAGSNTFHSFGYGDSDAFTEAHRLNGSGNANLGMLAASEVSVATGAGAKIGFYGTAPIVKQTGVAVTAAAIHAALVNLGLIAA